jgi:hypothetical protein
MRISDDGQAGKNVEPAPKPEVQYLLVGTLIGTILLMIVFSLLTVH